MTRILIADDRESMRMALKTLFVLRPNWEICGEAEDGREAVSKATDLRPDLVVLDFKMPWLMAFRLHRRSAEIYQRLRL